MLMSDHDPGRVFRRLSSSWARLTLCVVAWMAALGPLTLHARPPEIRNVNLRGLQIGGKTVVTVDGSDLLPAPRVWLNGQSLEATLEPQSTATRAILSVALPENTQPGMGVLRIGTADGISNSVLVGLDRFPQTVAASAVAATPAALPVALHGSVPGSGVSVALFSGKAAQEVLVEVEARRLGSKLRPVLHVYDSHRRQIGWSMPQTLMAGDCRLSLKLPSDDTYTVEVHDVQYAPPGPSFFRLKLGQWQYTDLAFPPAVTRGHATSLQLFGNGSSVLPFQAPTDSDLAPVWRPIHSENSGLPTTVIVSALPELLQISSVDKPLRLPPPPFAVSGRFDGGKRTPGGQKDRFLLPVTPGQKLIFEVQAERIGSRIDAVLELRNAQGGVLATMDDGVDTIDPRLEFAVPAGMDVLEIILRNALDGGADSHSDQAVYRLVITSADQPVRDFEATLKSDVINVAPDDAQVLEVFASRQNYDGAIKLQIPDLPPGFVATGTEIPAGSSGTLVTVVNASNDETRLFTKVMAQSAEGAILKPLRAAFAPDDRTPPWLRTQFAIASAPKASSPFVVAWATETPPHLALASKPVMPVVLTRPAATFGPVRLTLVTSQSMPLQNGQPSLPFAVRQERPLELPVDPAVKAAGDALAPLVRQHAEAVQQATVAQGDAKTAADAKVQDLLAKKTAAETSLKEAETKAIYKTDLAVIIPAVLPESSCDLSIRAELLNPEKNTVLRTVYAPVRRLPVRNPLSIVAAKTLEATYDGKTAISFKLTAKIDRLPGYAGAVTVALTGLPPGVTAPANTAVKAEQTDFEIEFKIPANFAAPQINGLKLTATGPGDPLTANQPVKSAEVEVSLKLNKPPA